MPRVSSPASNPFSTASAAEGDQPYVAPQSLRGAHYRAPGGYRYHASGSWPRPGRLVVLALLGVAGLVVYLRSDRILPVLMGTTTTRVPVSDRAASAVNPWTGEAHWGRTPQQAEAFPLDFPSHLPPTAAGTAADGGPGVVKCVQSDGPVVYQQRDCGAAAPAGRSASGRH
jgi:hypothetical protein